MANYQYLIKDIFELLESNGYVINKSDLQRIAGVSRHVIAKIISGEEHHLRVDSLANLGRYLGVPVQRLVKFMPDDTSNIPTPEEIAKIWANTGFQHEITPPVEAEKLADGDLNIHKIDVEIDTLGEGSRKSSETIPSTAMYRCIWEPVDDHTRRWVVESADPDTRESMQKEGDETHLVLAGGIYALGRSKRRMQEVRWGRPLLFKDDYLSGLHLRLSFAGQQGILFVEDCESRNETHIRYAETSEQPVRLLPGYPQALETGDRIIIAPLADPPKVFRINIKPVMYGSITDCGAKT